MVTAVVAVAVVAPALIAAAGSAAASTTGVGTVAATNALTLGLSGTLGEAGATVAVTASATGPFAIVALVVGAALDETSAVYTYDCWKPVVHDDSPDPSNGRLLGELAADPRIKNVHTSDNNESSLLGLPEIILENIWNERFRIEYVELPSGGIAAHAVQLE